MLQSLENEFKVSRAQSGGEFKNVEFVGLTVSVTNEGIGLNDDRCAGD